MQYVTTLPVYSPIKTGTSFCLDAVLTKPEVCAMWNVDRKTVQLHIDRGTLEGRQSGVNGVWLVTRASVVRLWGNPQKEIDEL